MQTEALRVGSAVPESIFQPATAGVVQRDRKRSLWLTYLAIVTLFLLNSIWFIWSHRFLPLQDYPDWLYQGFILSKCFQRSAVPGFSIKPYPIPDSTFSVLLGILDLGLPAEISGKLMLTLMVFAFVLGSLYLLTSLQVRETPLLYVPLALCFNSFFFWGYCAYYLALGMFFFFCGYLLRTRRESNRALVTVMLVVLFMTHLLPYLAALGVVAIVAVNETKDRGMRAAIASLVVIAPSVCLLLWYVIGRVQSGELAHHGWVWWTNWHLFVGSFVYALAPFRIFLPFVTERSLAMQGAALLNVLWAAMVAGAFAATLKAALSCKGRRSLIARCAGCFILAYVAAGYNVGLGNTGERFLIPALLLSCCWLTSRRALTAGETAMLLRLSLVGMVAAQLLWLDTVAAQAAGRLEGVYREMRTAWEGDSLCSTYARYFDASWPTPGRRDMGRFLPDAAVTIRIPYYIYIENDVSAPVLPFGPLHYQGSGNYSNLCEGAVPGAAYRGRKSNSSKQSKRGSAPRTGLG